MKEIIVPEKAKTLLNALHNEGHEAYVVGGFVRDRIIEKSTSDVDITTSATPNEVKTVLSHNNIKCFETGIKHGTVTANFKNENFEITTYRTDGEYKDNRHPENVKFVKSLEEDLKRRDFTINALAYNDEAGLVDPFGGIDDINNKIIRCVGDPDKRFNEDALRIIRALRFSSVLNFSVEEATKNSIHKNKELLNNVAGERIFQELLKLLDGENVLNVLSEYSDVIAVIIPEFKATFTCEQNSEWHVFNVYDHIINSVAEAPPEGVLRLTMLFHDIGKPLVKKTDPDGTDHFYTHAKVSAKMAEEILRRFNASNKIISRVTLLISKHQKLNDVDKINVNRWITKIGANETKDLFKVRIADLKAHNPEKVGHEIEKLTEYLNEFDEILSEAPALSRKDLAIGGKTLKKLGFSGEIIGVILNEVLENVVDGKLDNTKEDIIQYVNSKEWAL